MQENTKPTLSFDLLLIDSILYVEIFSSVNAFWVENKTYAKNTYRKQVFGKNFYYF